MMLAFFCKYLLIFTIGLGHCSESDIETIENHDAVDEDWGDGLKVMTTYMPPKCEFKAKKSDTIHYHYVGRLASDGTEFGKSFDYNTPYIVALGHGRIIPGMDRGLMGTCLWERRRISFPAHLGYGARGVGKTIPPNSALVFYIRLIKIERNGHALGEDADLPGIWNSGLVSYTEKDWEVAIDMIEEAIRLYNQYEKESLLCHRECQKVDPHVSSKNKKVLEDYLSNSVINEALVHYPAKGKCLRECKSKSLPPQLRQPDALLLKKFKQRLPYSYLHFSYYQVNQMELAARSCFTFLHFNPSDVQTISNLQYYRHNLNLTADVFIYRDPSIEEYQKPYRKGEETYGSERWLEAVDWFELSLLNFKSSLEDCYLLCEDVVNVNLTQPDMSPMKKELLQEYGFKSDTMEYYDIQVLAIVEVLKCRDQCYFQASIIEGQHSPDFFTSHFNFLQYAQYKLGNIARAAESAATFLEMEPSDDAMTNNVRYYTSQFKLTAEQFVPRKEYTDIHQEHVMDRQLLQFAEEGIMRKQGIMGDDGVSSKDEL